jgi:hypothetical protein
MDWENFQNNFPIVEQTVYFCSKAVIITGSKLYLVGMLQDNLFKYGMIWGRK